MFCRVHKAYRISPPPNLHVHWYPSSSCRVKRSYMQNLSIPHGVSMGCSWTIASIATNSSLYLWASGRSSGNNTAILGLFHRSEKSSAFYTDTEGLQWLDEGHTTSWWPSPDWGSYIIQAFLLLDRPQCFRWRAHHPHCCIGGLVKNFSLLMGSESWVVIIISHFGLVYEPEIVIAVFTQLLFKLAA